MAEEIDLKELEKKVYRSTFQDGIWDIFVGMIFLAFSFIPITGQLGLPELIGTLLISLIWNISAVIFMVLAS